MISGPPKTNESGRANSAPAETQGVLITHACGGGAFDGGDAGRATANMTDRGMRARWLRLHAKTLKTTSPAIYGLVPRLKKITYESARVTPVYRRARQKIWGGDGSLATAEPQCFPPYRPDTRSVCQECTRQHRGSR